MEAQKQRTVATAADRFLRHLLVVGKTCRPGFGIVRREGRISDCSAANKPVC